MKKVISILAALVLMCCAVASVSAEISPTATIRNDYIIVDAVPVPDEAGDATPGIDNSGKVQINSGEVITLTATPKDGYKFSHWEFIYGEFEIISGDLTTPTIVIKPTGDENVRAYAHFVKEGEDVTTPSSKPVHKPDDGTQSPTTGENVAVYASVGTMLVALLAGVIVLKKRQNA